MDRQDRHSDGFLELFEHLAVEVVRVCMFPLLKGVETHFLGVTGAEFEQGELVPLDRDPELHAVDFDVRKERDDDLPGKLSELGFNLGDECTEDRCRLFFYVHLETEIQGLDNRSSPDPQEVAECFSLVAYEREDIEVAVGRACDYGLGIMLLE